RIEFKAKKVAILVMPRLKSILPALVQHPPIVTGYNQQGVVGQAFTVQQAHHLTDHPVELVDEIAIPARLTRADKLRRRRKRVVNVRRRKVQEKRLTFMRA